MIRLLTVAALASTLIACGGGAKLAPTKEAAAQAMFNASQNSARSAQGAFEYVNGMVMERTISCRNGGKASFKIDFNTVGQNGDFSYDLKFDGCSNDGKTRMSGTLRSRISFTTSGGNMSMNIGFKGRLDLSGEIDDFLEADVVQTISLTSIDQTSGTVTVRLQGTIRTSEATHTYNQNDTISFTAGGYTAAPRP